MGKFFNGLVSENLINDWASILDWLFDDMKFSKERNWNSGYITSYTKKLKKLKYLSDKDKRVVYDRLKNVKFPNQCKKQRRKRSPYIIMLIGDSFARDLIRHIRNRIAHGESVIMKVGDMLYVEIIDYSNHSKRENEQTAYLFLPLSYINDFFKTYDEINRSIMHTTKKDQKATKKFRRGQ